MEMRSSDGRVSIGFLGTSRSVVRRLLELELDAPNDDWDSFLNCRKKSLSSSSSGPGELGVDEAADSSTGAT
jgi:hypothetical protein